jgi:ubiquitin-protein ligase
LKSLKRFLVAGHEREIEATPGGAPAVLPTELGRSLALTLGGWLRASELAILETSESRELYAAVYHCVEAVAKIRSRPGVGIPASFADLVTEQARVAEAFFKDGAADAQKHDIVLMKALKQLGAAIGSSPVPGGASSVKARAAARAPARVAAPSTAPSPGTAPDDGYEAALRPLCFGADEALATEHAFANEAKALGDSAYKSGPCLRRLRRELRQMRGSMPVTPGSSIALRHDPKRPYLLQFLITGPEGTPYDSGCFLFDALVPPEYPVKPPKVKFRTTGLGTVRFNPNLYQDGKVCLSLLGTWNGPGWTPGRSTLLQVLVSIQAQVLGVERPYYNEPGREKYRGTDRGRLEERTATNGGYERLRAATVQWAMVHMLANPPRAFATFVQEHFRRRRRHILDAVLKPWNDHAQRAGASDHKTAMKAQADAMRSRLCVPDKGSPDENPPNDGIMVRAVKAARGALSKVGGNPPAGSSSLSQGVDAGTTVQPSSQVQARAPHMASCDEMKCAMRGQGPMARHLKSLVEGPRREKRSVAFMASPNFSGCKTAGCYVCRGLSQAIKDQTARGVVVDAALLAFDADFTAKNAPKLNTAATTTGSDANLKKNGGHRRLFLTTKSAPKSKKMPTATTQLPIGLECTSLGHLKINAHPTGSKASEGGNACCVIA